MTLNNAVAPGRPVVEGAVSYGGLYMEIVRSKLNRRAVLDGPTYIWTEYEIDVEAIVNPATMSYGIQGSPPRATQSPGLMASVTDKAIRFLLMQPRLQLVYKPGGGAAMVVSPAPGAAMDCSFGPQPTRWDVEEVHGVGKTFRVRWTCKTWVNESALFSGSNGPPMMVSHRWTMSHDIDPEDFRVTRVIKGRAVFRTDLLPASADPRQAFLPPDTWRQFLLPACPNGWERGPVQVIAEEDGQQIDYVCVDRQVRKVITVAGVRKIEVLHGAGVKGPDLGEIGLNAADTLGSVVTSQFEEAAAVLGALPHGMRARRRPTMRNIREASRDVGGLPPLQQSGIVGIARRFYDFFRSSMPLQIVNLDIRVHGTVQCPTTTLSQVAWIVLRARVNNILENLGMYAWDFYELHDCGTERAFVQLKGDFVAGLSQNTINLLVGGLGGAAFAPNVTGAFPSDSDIIGTPAIFNPGVASGNPPALAPVAGAQVPPFDGGSRGYYLGLCLAQALQEATSAPFTPSEPGVRRPDATNPGS